MTTPEGTLEAMDAALAEGRVTDPETSELQELALALRAESPRPSPDLVARMDERMAAGFPRKQRIRLPGLPRLAALGGAAAAAVAVIVAVSLGTHGNDNSPGGSTVSASSAVEKSSAGGATAAGPSAAADSAGSTAQSAPAAKALAAPAPAGPRASGPRHVERSASITLAAARNKLESVANEIVAVVDRHHGYVLHPSVTSGSRRRRLVRPARAGGLAAGHARRPLGPRRRALAQPERERRDQLLQRHERSPGHPASTAPEPAQAARGRHHRLTGGRAAQPAAPGLGQIRSLSAQFDALRQRTSLASVEVSLVPKRARAAVTTGGIGGDLHDAFHSLVVSFGIALRVLGIAIPLALVGGLAWLAAAMLRRRRREAALF